MNGKNIAHYFLILDVGCLYNCGTRRIDRRVQVIGHCFPTGGSCRFNVECVADKIKSNIIRKRNFYLIKSLLNNLPRVIRTANRRNRVSYHDEIERGFLTNRNDFLELTKRVFVQAEEVAELIPNEYNFCVVLINNIE